MPEQPSFGSLSSPRPTPAKPESETPFRIAVLGDFTGRSGRPAVAGAPPLKDRKPVAVRHDALDEAPGRLGAALRLSAAGEKVALKLGALDDFHPDQIYDQVDILADMSQEEQNELMRAILHHRDFQILESAWRGLEWLLRRADKGGRVEVVLYDVTRDELAADLTASEDLSRGALYQLLVEKATQGPKGKPWGLLVGDYLFDRSAADAKLLGRLAKIASHANAPFLAGAAPAIHAASAMPTAAAAAWTALRALPEASMLGLVLPRFLLRPPYGPNTTSIDRFDFEELEDSDNPKAKKPYLWGNGALTCAALLAQSFHKQGWAFKPGGLLDLTEMPMHVGTDEDGDPLATVAEAWMDRRLTEPLSKQGFMCLLGVRGSDALQLLRFQSLAQPPKDRPFCDLWGPWGQEGVGPAASSAPPLTAKVGFAADMAIPAAPAPPPPRPAVPSEGEAPAAPASEPPPGADAAEPAAAEDAAVDDELNALLQEFDQPAAAGGETPPSAEGGAPAADAADAELDSLLNELGGDLG